MRVDRVEPIDIWLEVGSFATSGLTSAVLLASGEAAIGVMMLGFCLSYGIRAFFLFMRRRHQIREEAT